MFANLVPARSLLLAIFIVMTGSGCLSTLIGLRLVRMGSGTLVVGAVATAYFAGLVIGALRAGAIVRQVGHIRTFAVFVSLLSASTLAYAVSPTPLLWGFLRLIDGLCVAGIFVCVESWLNELSDPRGRGGLLAAYMVALYSGQALGQWLLTIGGDLPAMPFQLASILISLALIPVCLTRAAAPSLSDARALSLAHLYRTSPLGVVGAASTGMMLAAFYALAAVHVRQLGLDIVQTAAFMTAVIAGGILLQWPLGKLSDRYDRRRVILASLAATWLISLAIAAQTGPGITLLGSGALFGGLAFALYPLCVAHTHDRRDTRERLAASSGLILVYSLGAVVGPLGGSIAMAVMGSAGLFAFIGLCSGGALAFGIWRVWSRTAVPSDVQQRFQVLPRTTPALARLDPHGPRGRSSGRRDRSSLFVG